MFHVTYQPLLEYYPNIDKFLHIVDGFNPKDQMFKVWENACLYHFAKKNYINMKSKYIYKYINDKSSTNNMVKKLLKAATGKDFGEV